MKNLLRPYSLPEMQTMADNAMTSGGGTKGKYHKFEDNTKYFFHLLPPWEGSKVFAQPIYECFGLPKIPGRKFFRHILWKSFEAVEPGIGAKDPVMAVLEHFRPQMEEAFKKWVPFNPRYYMNMILVGSTRIKPGTMENVPDTYKEEAVPLVRTVGISGPIFNSITSFIIAADKSAEGRLDNPLASAMIGIGKKNDGKQVRYAVEIIGTTMPQGIVPNRYNLVEKYGESEVERLYTEIPNLFKVFPVPSESERVEAGSAARALKEVLSNMAAKTPGAPQAGTTPNGDGSQTIGQAPAAAALPAAPPAAPPTQTSTYTSKDIVSRDLGLSAAPTNADGKPLCFGHISHVAKSPNAYWCGSCPWANSCKLMKGTQA